MQRDEAIDQLIDFAIGEEEAAAAFYKDLAAKMDRPWMREIFEQFSQEEQGHKAKLQKIKSGAMPFTVLEKVPDLKIGDYLVEAELNADMDYQQALIVAMQKEKAAFRMYTDLAAATSSAELRTALLSLAQEEAKHKLRFEVEYDDIILKEN